MLLGIIITTLILLKFRYILNDEDNNLMYWLDIILLGLWYLSGISGWTITFVIISIINVGFYFRTFKTILKFHREFSKYGYNKFNVLVKITLLELILAVGFVLIIIL